MSLALPLRRAPGRLRLLRVLAVSALVMLAMAFYTRADYYLQQDASAAPHPLLDFDTFQVVGQMALSGEIAAAYRPAEVYAREAADSRQPGHGMPWAYPPQFDLIVAGLALLPRAWAYILFIGASLLGYALVLRRLAGPAFELVALAAAPGLIATIFSGQNGLLIASLAGLFALLALDGRRWAGLPLGLMVMKPHLALGLGLWVLLRGRWRLIAEALAAVALSAGLATLAFGAAVWPAFLGGLRATGEILAHDSFQFFRLSSVYAALRGLGLAREAALAGQGAAALLAAGLVLWSVRRGLPARVQLGLAVLASLAISPYAYDYDMPLYGIGFALLWPALAPRLGRGALAAVLALGWALGGWSVWLSLGVPNAARLEALVWAGRLPAVAGLLLVLQLAIFAGVLRRPLGEAER